VQGKLDGVTFAGRNLARASFDQSSLKNVNFSQADLTHADLSSTDLTGADLTGANINGARFYRSSISVAQLQSTATYANGDLSSVNFESAHLAGADFSGKNLTDMVFTSADLHGANFANANLTNAILAGASLANVNLTGANVQGASFGHGISQAQFYSTDTYQHGSLAGIGLSGLEMQAWNFEGKNLQNANLSTDDLAGANFRGANLRNANFAYSSVPGADFSGADIRGAYFFASDAISAAQLYTTSSYQAKDLSGTRFNDYDFKGWNFASQNLTNTAFGNVFGGTDFTGADFSGADLRGAAGTTLFSAITHNTIRPDGHVFGVDLTSSARLVVHNYQGNPDQGVGLLPLHVEGQFAMDASGVLRLEFDADPWNSIILFDRQVTVALGGTLDLEFATGIDVGSQIGRTFRIFDWTGVAPQGVFRITTPYSWDLSRLYTTGEITLVPEPSTLMMLVSGILMTCCCRRPRVS
jgi:uncharacterized protein YjbI with pentapeptide repeats